MASFALVGLYIYYILFPELDDSAKDIISKVISAVESGFDVDENLESEEADESTPANDNNNRRNLESTSSNKEEYESRSYQYQKI